MKKESKPRRLTGIWSRTEAVRQGKTWLEPEEFTYPSGGFHRRAYVRCPDGKYRVVKCAVADTLFTIPAHLVYKKKHISGWVSTDEKSEDKEFVFLPAGKHRDVFEVPIAPLGGSPEKKALFATLPSEHSYGLGIPKEVLGEYGKYSTATALNSLERSLTRKNNSS